MQRLKVRIEIDWFLQARDLRSAFEQELRIKSATGTKRATELVSVLCKLPICTTGYNLAPRNRDAMAAISSK